MTQRVERVVGSSQVRGLGRAGAHLRAAGFPSPLGFSSQPSVVWADPWVRRSWLLRAFWCFF